MLFLLGIGQQFKNPFHTPWLYAKIKGALQGDDNCVGSSMIFMFRIFPKNFLIRNTSVFLDCFVKEATLGFFFPVNKYSFCLLFSFYCFSLFFLFYRWFHQGTNPYTGTPDWLYSGGYFDRNFSDCPDIYWNSRSNCSSHPDI